MSAATLGRRLARPRLMYLAVAGAAAALIGYALYLQQADGLEPCPLCILQRYAFVGVGALALIAAALPRLPARLAAWLGIVCGLAGAGVGAWHVWLQLHPPRAAACGPSLGYLIENLPLARALPRVFQGYGECTDIQWTFLGLTIPAWSLIWLLALALALAYAQARRAN